MLPVTRRLFALTGLLRALPWHARRRQCYLPDELLKEHSLTREEDIVNGIDSARLRLAWAMSALKIRHHMVELRRRISSAERNCARLRAFDDGGCILAAMERPNYQPFESVIELPQWQRVWRMWRQVGRPPLIARLDLALPDPA